MTEIERAACEFVGLDLAWRASRKYERCEKVIAKEAAVKAEMAGTSTPDWLPEMHSCWWHAVEAEKDAVRGYKPWDWDWPEPDEDWCDVCKDNYQKRVLRMQLNGKRTAALRRLRSAVATQGGQD